MMATVDRLAGLLNTLADKARAAGAVVTTGRGISRTTCRELTRLTQQIEAECEKRDGGTE